MACVYLTGFLSKRLFPEIQDRQRVQLIMAGGIPFMIYGTLVMFDFVLCAFVLLSLICLYYFRQERHLRYALLMGLCFGMGVLTKGPVAYLSVLPVALRRADNGEFQRRACAPVLVLLAIHPGHFHAVAFLSVILARPVPCQGRAERARGFALSCFLARAGRDRLFPDKRKAAALSRPAGARRRHACVVLPSKA